jgi:membrane-bound lytic murein transglycosylase D
MLIIMKDLATFIATATLVILLGYIVYNEQKPIPAPSAHDTVVEPVADEEALLSLTEPASGFVVKPIQLPTTIAFAGEVVPLHMADVRERLDRELQINSYLHSSTLFIMKRAGRWLPAMERILKENNIPEDFKYLPLIESALQNAVSPAEAVGFWQIVKSAGKSYGLEIGNEVDERYDPIKSTHAACRYLKDAHRKFGSWTLAAASYNRGMSGLQKAIDNQKVNSYYDLFLNDETSRYVFRLLAMKEIMENPAKYGFELAAEELYQPEPVRYVEVTQTIKSLVDFSLANGTNYKTLKRLNPWLRDEKLKIKSGKTYRIALPA